MFDSQEVGEAVAGVMEAVAEVTEAVAGVNESCNRSYGSCICSRNGSPMSTSTRQYALCGIC